MPKSQRRKEFIRKLHPSEVRLFLFADAAFPDTAPTHRYLHAVRETVNGNKVPACQQGVSFLADGYNYWSFPLLDFLLVNAPVCEACIDVLTEEDLIIDTRHPAQAETP